MLLPMDDGHWSHSCLCCGVCLMMVVMMVQVMRAP